MDEASSRRGSLLRWPGADKAHSEVARGGQGARRMRPRQTRFPADEATARRMRSTADETTADKAHNGRRHGEQSVAVGRSRS